MKPHFEIRGEVGLTKISCSFLALPIILHHLDGVSCVKGDQFLFQKSREEIFFFLSLPLPHHRKHIRASQTINLQRSATIVHDVPSHSSPLFGKSQA